MQLKTIESSLKTLKMLLLFSSLWYLQSGCFCVSKLHFANTDFYKAAFQIIKLVNVCKHLHFPRCLPASDLCLLIEVHGSFYYEEQFKPVCWSKFLLFDNQHRVISGKWKVPLRIVPSRPDIHPKDANNIPQVL